MPENKSNIYQSTAIIIDPQTKQQLGQISLTGDSIPANEWINTNGPLQRFIVVEGMDDLRRVWVYQEDVLLRTNYGQRLIKIITYPTEGENQGFLDYTSEFEKYQKPSSKFKSRISTRRGLAFLNSLLGT